ncbi:hypothetical protein IT575_12570 [bacterium]|nr:hypothetical protein [bacterium]
MYKLLSLLLVLLLGCGLCSCLVTDDDAVPDTVVLEDNPDIVVEDTTPDVVIEDKTPDVDVNVDTDDSTN